MPARGDLMVIKKLLELNEYNAAGLFEEPDRGLFYRKALGLKRFYENCNLTKYNGELLYPSGETAMPNHQTSMAVDFWRLDEKDKELKAGA